MDNCYGYVWRSLWPHVSKRWLKVIELETGRTIREVDVSGKSNRTVERIETKMLRSMNLKEFSVVDSNDEYGGSV